MKLRTDPDGYFRQSLETLRAHADEALLLMGRERWDLCFTMWHMGDTLKHHFWTDMAGKTEDGGRRHYIRDYYEEADRQLGRLVDAAGERATTIVMSDHGHKGIERAIHLNTWLAREGYLRVETPRRGLVDRLARRFGRPVRRLLAAATAARGASRREGDQGIEKAFESIGAFEQSIVWSETRAYAARPGFVWINRSDREPLGTVPQGAEYLALRERLRADLAKIRDPLTKEPVFDEIVAGDEVYGGDAIEDAPDLIVMPRGGYITEYGPGAKDVVTRARPRGFNGYHVLAGMVAIAGPDVRAETALDGARIVDVAPTILHLLGLPVQPAMDGRVLESALSGEFLARAPVRVEEIPVSLPGDDAEGSDEDGARVAQNLKDLGYM